MKTVLAFFKLIRIHNLLIVAATQYLMRYAIIWTILQTRYSIYLKLPTPFQLQVTNFDFFILVLATVCLTAGGYVINDYFDTKTDTLNRPNTVVVGKIIYRRSAMAIHIVLNVIAVLGGFYVSYKIGHYKFGFIFILVSGVLWYYSTTYKRQFLIGNLIVSLLTGLVPLMVILFEIPVLNEAYSDILMQYGISFYLLFYWVLAFSFFAFITNLIREIIKDIEDYEGDSAYGRNTLPIVLGVLPSKIIISILSSITITSFIIIYLKYLSGSQLTMWYLIIGQILPFLLLIIRVITAKTKKHYHIASGLMKIIMLIGLLYSLVAAYTFFETFK
jgi:4-hydroxybenzoate polyprenyltransferase